MTTQKRENSHKEAALHVHTSGQNLSKQNPTFQAIQSMQEKGLESDPRYSTLLSFARNAQQMQQMPGFSSEANPNAMGNMGPASGQQVMNSSNEGFGNEEHSTMSGNPGKNAGFSPDQINQLRNQIMAYKLLSHNQPLTEQIKMSIQSKGASSRVPNVHSSTTDRPGPGTICYNKCMEMSHFQNRSTLSAVIIQEQFCFLTTNPKLATSRSHIVRSKKARLVKNEKCPGDVSFS